MNTRTYGLYVIQLGDDDRHIYVGCTYLTAAERMSQHLSGYKAARIFKRGSGGKLRPDLYRGLPRYDSRIKAERAEAKLAEKLRLKGYRVEGGH